MRRPLITTAITCAVVGLLLTLKPHGRPATTTTAVAGSQGSPAARSRSGRFTGDAVQTLFGVVQVQITLAEGRLVAVTVLQAPDEDVVGQGISSSALPILEREAMRAGSADIDVVSGATYTSQGYIGSLQSALDQARG